MSHNGPVLSGNKRFQRVTVGVIIGLVVVALALTLVGPALAAPAAGAALPLEAAPAVAPSPTPGSSGLVGTTDPKPVTQTPQGTSTQVSDTEHLGGLIAYVAFMLGGVLLLIRARRRERRERLLPTAQPIL